MKPWLGLVLLLAACAPSTPPPASAPVRYPVSANPFPPSRLAYVDLNRLILSPAWVKVVRELGATSDEPVFEHLHPALVEAATEVCRERGCDVAFMAGNEFADWQRAVMLYDPRRFGGKRLSDYAMDITADVLERLPH